MAEGDGSPRLSVHAWSAQLQERTICFQALRLEGQVMIWVGEEPVLGCLAMAVPLVDCPSTQVRSAHRCAFLLKTRSNEISAQVIGNNDQSLQLSSHLAKKLSKQVTRLIKRYISSRPNLFTPTGSGELQLGR